MLKTLLKWELKAGARFIPFLYVGILFGGLLAMVGQFITRIEFDNVTVAILVAVVIGIMNMLSYGIIVVALMITIYHSVYRFYRTMASDEAYLMFTLPVTRSKHLLSHVLSSCIWGVGGIISAAAAYAISFIGSPTFIEDIKGIIELIKMVFEGKNVFIIILYVIVAVLLVVAYYLYSILIYATGITIGQGMLKNKVGGSILGCVILYFVSQFVTLVALGVLMLLIFLLADVENFILIMMFFILVFYAGASAVMYAFINNRITKKYNLE